jgi:hypothetical protein
VITVSSFSFVLDLKTHQIFELKVHSYCALYKMRVAVINQSAIDELLIQQTVIASMPFPRKYDLNLIQNFWSTLDYPLGGPDRAIWGRKQDPDKHAPDLVALRGRKQDDAFSKWLAEKGSKLIFKIFHKYISQSKSTGLKSIKDKTLLKWASGVTTIIASTLPSISVTVLYVIKSTPMRLLALAIFNIVIAICLTSFTAAKRLDIFAVSAAYVRLN